MLRSPRHSSASPPALSGSLNFLISPPAMSSNDDDYNDHKKRRVQRACDICRRKKSMYPSTVSSFFSHSQL